ncbi:ankyrin repeat domain-containing protein [Leptospira weilii]|uniref:Ankyrin repeat protein n=2 Tax=Leptospira weilii TaxID=28184 RepID=M6FRI5_9LEPT|nr:ankyrin repeat domain-containing protein [Leptospira weilii]EMM73772.1 ankyrin repeat protein [Leptospira weilii str. 2006001855]MCL8268230.1 ankyrin repeat domain-containing protein [Leptospira weilii]
MSKWKIWFALFLIVSTGTIFAKCPDKTVEIEGYCWLDGRGVGPFNLTQAREFCESLRMELPTWSMFEQSYKKNPKFFNRPSFASYLEDGRTAVTIADDTEQEIISFNRGNEYNFVRCVAKPDAKVAFENIKVNPCNSRNGDLNLYAAGKCWLVNEPIKSVSFNSFGSWKDAMKYCHKENSRLPTKTELLEILNLEKYDPLVDFAYEIQFSLHHNMLGPYWTSVSKDAHEAYAIFTEWSKACLKTGSGCSLKDSFPKLYEKKKRAQAICISKPLFAVAVRNKSQKSASQTKDSKETPDEILLRAVQGKTEDKQLVQQALLSGAHVNVRENYYNKIKSYTFEDTALMIAIKNKQREVAKLLIRSGADPTYQNNIGLTALHLAANSGDLELTNHLLKHGAKVDQSRKDGWSPLMSAIDGRHVEVSNLLIQNGAKVTEKDVDGNSPLLLAVSRDLRTDFVESLIKSGAEVNVISRGGGSALFSACFNRNLSMIQLLIRNQADLTIKNDYGTNLLMAVASSGKNQRHALQSGPDIITDSDKLTFADATKEIVELLINGGLEVNGRDSLQRTALMFAAQKNDVPMMEVLLKKGADINIQDGSGYTALIWSILFNNPEATKYLLKHRPDTNLQTKDEIENGPATGCTALMYANGYNNTEIAKLLLSSGAKPTSLNCKARL